MRPRSKSRFVKQHLVASRTPEPLGSSVFRARFSQFNISALPVGLRRRTELRMSALAGHALHGLLSAKITRRLERRAFADPETTVLEHRDASCRTPDCSKNCCCRSMQAHWRSKGHRSPIDRHEWPSVGYYTRTIWAGLAARAALHSRCPMPLPTPWPCLHTCFRARLEKYSTRTSHAGNLCY